MEISIVQPRSTEGDIELTIEQVLYVALFAMALSLRLWNLGSIPLDSQESNIALQSWSIYKGLPATTQASPLLIHLNSVVFLVFGASDASARALSAFVGSSMILLPYLFRQYIGRSIAFSAAILLTLSPTLVFFSRYGNEAIITAALSLGLVAAFVAYVNKRSPSDFFLYLSAVLLALLLSSGAPAYVNLFMFVVFLVGIVLLKKLTAEREWGAAEELSQLPSLHEVWPRREKARNWAIVFGITLVIALTGGLTDLHGIQEGTINTLALALRGPRTDVAFSSYLQILLVYEILVAIFAAINVFFYNGRHGAFSWFLVWWAGASLVIFSLMPQKSAALIVQPLVPITLLAAEPVGRLFEWFIKERPLATLGVLALVSAPPFLLIVLLLSSFSLTRGSSSWVFAVIPVFVLVLAVAGSLYWRGRTYSAHIWGLLCLVALFAMTLHTMANLNYQPEPNPSELLRGKSTALDVRNLASDVELALGGAASQGMEGGILVDPSQKELLGWYLRKYNPTFSGMDSQPLIFIGRADADLPLGQWAIQRYSISASAPRPNDLGQFWRWLIYREVPAQIKYDTVTMYVSLQ